MRRETVLVTVSTCLTIIAASTIVTHAGPLEPPGGPVTPTYKTLDQVEPRIPIGPDTTPGDAESIYRITQGGSYYLTGDVQALDGKHGIKVEAAGTSVDLNGFELKGFVFGGSSLSGIVVVGNNNTNVTIRNGSVRNWGTIGVTASGTSGVTIESVTSSFNGLDGFNLGEDATISGCGAVGNGRHGFNIGSGSAISNARSVDNDEVGYFLLNTAATACTAVGNGAAGFSATRSTLTGCVARQNGMVISGSGISATGSVLTDCVASDNGEHGIRAISQSLVRACLAEGHAENGIDLFSSDARDCNAAGNDGDGISSNGIGGVVGCKAYVNLGVGIRFGGTSGRVEGNDVTANSGIGILVENGGCIVENNICNQNQTGIATGDDCRIRNNTCSNNGGAAFLVTGRESLIEHNRAANNGFGYIVQNDRNLVVANVARDNGSNYEIVAGNRVGKLVIPPLSGAISGASDPDALGAGTTDPWANFSY